MSITARAAALLAAIFLPLLVVTQTAGQAGPQVIVVSDGDSLTSGYGVEANANYPANIAAIHPTWQVHNEGIGGSYCRDLLQTAPTRIDTRYQAGKTNIAILWCGINDYGIPRTVNQTFHDVRDWSLARRAVGFKTVIVTLTGIGDPHRASLNNLYRSTWPQWADALVDLDKDPRVGIESTFAAAPWFQADHVHPSAVGYAAIASRIDQELTRLVPGTVAPIPSRQWTSTPSATPTPPATATQPGESITPTPTATEDAMSWWDSGGATGVLAAYEPIGAPDLASSYINRANAGTNDAAPGVAPTWNATDGWIFNGTTQWLDTAIVPATGYSMIVRFSAGSNTGTLVGVDSSPDNARFYLWPGFGAGVVYGHGNLVIVAPTLAAGTIAVAGNQGYRNGTAEGAAIGAWNNTQNDAIPIGARRDPGGSPTGFAAAKVQALAIYSSTLSGAQVAAITTAMNALPTDGSWASADPGARVLAMRPGQPQIISAGRSF